MFKRLIVFLLPALLAVGCDLREDLVDCGVLRLNFRFTWNNENVDQLDEHVRDIHVYAFDQKTGVLARIVELNPTEVARGWAEIRDLSDGAYTFVAWGGSSTDMLKGGFLDAEMSDADPSRSVTVGQTTLEEFYLMADYETRPSGEIAPKQETFDDLFHAAAEDVQVSAGTEQTVDFDFIRNTNVVKVHISGLDNLDTFEGQPLQVYLTAENGLYGWDNGIDSDARLVRYEPKHRLLTDTDMYIDIKTLHFDLSRHNTSNPILLYVIDPATGQILTEGEPIDLLKALRSVKDPQGNYPYRTQEDFDREYEFPIDIVISKSDRPDPVTGQVELIVKVFILEWEIVTTTADVDRP
jgi:hypothetical protein